MSIRSDRSHETGGCGRQNGQLQRSAVQHAFTASERFSRFVSLEGQRQVSGCRSDRMSPTKQADVGGKTVNFSDLQFNTLSQPASGLAGSSVSKGNVKFPDVDQIG